MICCPLACCLTEAGLKPRKDEFDVAARRAVDRDAGPRGDKLWGELEWAEAIEKLERSAALEALVVVAQVAIASGGDGLWWRWLS